MLSHLVNTRLARDSSILIMSSLHLETDAQLQNVCCTFLEVSIAHSRQRTLRRTPVNVVALRSAFRTGI